MYRPAGSGLSKKRETGERIQRGTPRGHGEGTEQTVEGKSGDQETPKAASSPPTLLFLESVPIDPVAGARLTWAMLLWVRSEPELREEREREKITGALVSFPRKSPSPPHALGRGAAPGTTATHQDDRAQTADEKGTDAHAEGQGSTPRLGATETPWPAQPDPAPPRHASAKAAHPPRPRPQLRSTASSALSQPLSRTPNYGPFLAAPTPPPRTRP